MVLSAQNGVTVSNLAVDAGTVTFSVSWGDNPLPAKWSDTVWVFVDYNDASKMDRLPLSSATLTDSSWPSASVIFGEDGNHKGVWVVGNARSAGSFSATVRLLTATATVSGACVYASNYPPVGKYTSAMQLVFTGTPPYNIVLKNEEKDTIYRTSGADFDIPGGYALESFTDATGAPGTTSCIPRAAQTLLASATAYCEGSVGVQLALNHTEIGVVYRLFDDNLGQTVASLSGTGSAATFSGSFAAGSYYAMVDAVAGYCSATMSGTHTVVAVALPEPPTVTMTAQSCSGSTITASSTVTDAQIVWTDNASAAATRYVTATRTYYAYVSDGLCTSSTASVSAAPIAKTANGQIAGPCGCVSNNVQYTYCLPSGKTFKVVSMSHYTAVTTNGYNVVGLVNHPYCLTYDCTNMIATRLPANYYCTDTTKKHYPLTYCTNSTCSTYGTWTPRDAQTSCGYTHKMLVY
jgi:hypothetical protein